VRLLLNELMILTGTGPEAIMLNQPRFRPLTMKKVRAL